MSYYIAGLLTLILSYYFCAPELQNFALTLIICSLIMPIVVLGLFNIFETGDDK